jgi:hypothetical protein
MLSHSSSVSNIAQFSASGEAKADSSAEYFDALNVWVSHLSYFAILFRL